MHAYAAPTTARQIANPGEVVAALEGFSREAYGGAPVVATAFAGMSYCEQVHSARTPHALRMSYCQQVRRHRLIAS